MTPFAFDDPEPPPRDRADRVFRVLRHIATGVRTFLDAIAGVFVRGLH